MDTQLITIGKRRYVLVPERDYLRLQKRAGELAVREEFGRDAMRELAAYRKTGKAEEWSNLKRKLRR